MLIPTIIIVAGSILAVLVAAILVFSSFLESYMLTILDSDSELMHHELENRKQIAALGARVAATDPEVIAALQQGDSALLSQRITALAQETGVEFSGIMDRQGKVLFRTNAPERTGDDLSGLFNIAQALEGNNVTLIETGTTIAMAISSGMPVRHPETGAIIGAVSCGFRLDQNEFVDSIRTLTGAQVSVFLGDRRISTTMLDPDGSRATDTKLENSAIAEQVLSGRDYKGKVGVLGQNTYVSYMPLYSYEGDVLGMFFVGRTTTARNRALVVFLLQCLAIAAVMLGIASAIIYAVAGKIAAPIKAMVKTADSLSQGEVEVEVGTAAGGELGELAASFRRMIARFREQAQLIASISEGDLSGHVEFHSNRDVVGKALHTMLDRNNQVFFELAGVADQVSAAAQQVSADSIQLAQNNNEDTAAIEQISASAAEVAQMAQQSTEKARHAARLGELAAQKAGDGSGRMQGVVDAVGAINQAILEIGKVIDTIEDIAFQTNILALNAAVEAAHTDTQSNGFAIVAEQVRALANKSTEAAHVTTDLIANSIEKAFQGMQIADETAQVFSDIVSDVGESSALIQEIYAHASDADQEMARISQQISALAQTSESTSTLSVQTAASSQQMAAQAQTLRSLVSRFRLRSTAKAGDSSRQVFQEHLNEKVQARMSQADLGFQMQSAAHMPAQPQNRT